MDFQVLGFYHGVIGIAQVLAGPVLGEVVGQGSLTGFIEARESGLGGAKIFAEESDGLGRRKRIVEKQFAPGHFEARFSAQAFGNDLFDSP